MKAIISDKEFDSRVEDADGEVLAFDLTATKAHIFAASEDLYNAVKRFLAATTAGEGHHAMVAMEEAIAKAEGRNA